MTPSRSRRALLIILLSALVVTVLYSTMRAYMGQVLARQYNGLSETLAAGPLLDTASLSYAPGIYSGTLTYRLEVDSDAMLSRDRAALAPVLAAMTTTGSAISGSVDVLQGPVWRSDHGWIWAVMSGTLGTGKGLSDTLPALNGAALAEWELRLKAGGLFTGEARIAGYDGAWSDTSSEVRWRPSTVHLHLGSRPDTMAFRLEATDLSLNNASGRAEAVGLSGQLAVVGQQQLSLESVAREITWQTGDTDHVRRIEQPEFSTSFYADEASPLGHEVRFSSANAVLPTLRLDGSRFEASLSDLDPDLYVQTLRDLGALVPSPRSPDRPAFLASLSDLLNRGAVIRLGPLDLSVSEPDDVSARFSMRAAGSESAPGSAVLRSPLDLLRRAEIELQAEATLGALRQYTHLLAEDEARLLREQRGLERTDEQIARSAATRYRSTLLALQFMPLVTVADGSARVQISLRGQTVYRNGNKLMSLEQLLTLLPGG